MFREKYAELRLLSWVADLAAVWLAFHLALAVRNHLLVGIDLPVVGLLEAVDVDASHWFLHWAVLLSAVLLRGYGVYHALRTASATRVSWTYLRFTVVLGGILTSLAYVTQAFQLSRSLVVLFVVSMAFLFSVKAFGVQALLHFLRRRGRQQHNLLVLGTGPRAQELLQRLRDHAEWGVIAVALLDRDPARRGREVEGVPVAGTLDDIGSLLDAHPIDEVVFAGPRSWLPDLDPVVRACAEVGIRFHQPIDLFDTATAHPCPSTCVGEAMISYETRQGGDTAVVFKRLVDVTVSALLLVALAPLLVVVAILISIASPGPVLFIQRRVGLNGRPFWMLKFRTMHVGAEQLQHTLRSFNEMQGPVFKMRRDPRVFAVGRWLRRFSIDELPQLVNVLKGDMSLVGPRPPLPVEVERYSRWQRRRLSMRPGLTGLWQVKGRNEVSFDDWMTLDLRYIDEWSLGLDLKVLAMTIPAILLGRGAF